MSNRLRKRQKLTVLQERFAKLVALHGVSIKQAYHQAGYSAESTFGAADLASHPGVLQRIQQLQQREVMRNASVATRVIREVMENEQQPASARIQAARLAYQAAGLARTEPSRPAEDGGDLSGKSAAELQREAADARARLDELRKLFGARSRAGDDAIDVTPEPDSAPDSAPADD